MKGGGVAALQQRPASQLVVVVGQVEEVEERAEQHRGPQLCVRLERAPKSCPAAAGLETKV